MSELILPVVDPGATLRMFPLGSVLLPGGMLPLRVFEPRYLVMMQEIFTTDGQFGVTLIERGSEVGGGDHRSMIGTLAVVVRADQLAGGRLSLLAVGASRFRVHEWLPDDPYPSAIVDPYPYDDAESLESLADPVVGLVAQLRSVLALASELGAAVAPATFDLPDDLPGRIDTVANRAPLGPHDRQQVLGVPTRAGQVGLLAELLTEELLVLEARRDQL